MVEKIDAFIAGAARLPALPTLMGRLLAAFDDPILSARTLSGIIVSDTTLAAKVLKLANSVFYHRMEPVASVDQATVRLGHKTIRSLVLTIWTQSLKSLSRQKGEMEAVTRLLKHGTASAIVASLLLQRTNRALVEDAYIAGLLHDIGRLALVCQMGVKYENVILIPAEAGQVDLLELERVELGFDHALLGTRLMQSWNIPKPCVKAAAEHHGEAIEAGRDIVLAGVALADAIVTGMGYNVALKARRSARDELAATFQLTDRPAFEQQCADRIDAVSRVLEKL